VRALVHFPFARAVQSTDGHNGNWSFSTTRLNWHVAERAARCGGVLLVDATRSATKRFPDALSKTVPIWAAVLNHAIAQHRDRAAGTPLSAATAAWRAGVALPPWVTPSEAAAIDARIPGWAASLLAVGADIAGLSALLQRPLRALWLSQASPLWGLPEPASLPFTPLLCVSASAPLSGHGQRHASNQACDGAAPEASERNARAYAYIPGAGDDEEAWACGLTPQLFWQHREQLLDAGSGDVAAVVHALVAAAPGGGLAPPGASPASLAALFCPAAASLSSIATGTHDLPPAGTHIFAAVAGALSGAPLDAGGVRWLADSGVGCASYAALADAPQLWRSADALLLCCDADCDEVAVAAAATLAPPPGALLCVRVAHAKADRASLALALPRAVAFASAHLAASRTVLVACPDGRERAPGVAVALLAACFEEEPEAAADGPPRVRFVGAAPPDAGASKLALRRWLAFLSAHHPDARPTRGLLKQAFRFLRGGNDQLAAWGEGEDA
jgi:tRNA A64-2'-O-ribosylphosphate transferase